MVQNFHSIISLCFGQMSHSSQFLKSWASHIYENRIMNTSLQTSDYLFYAKVLFCIDSALQTHWKSCRDYEDRSSVNDHVLFIQDQQEMILRHNFTQQVPKYIMDKVQNPNENAKQGGGGNGLGGGRDQRDKKNLDKKNLINNDDARHKKWRVKPGENFTKVFYFNQKKFPKTKEGKLICMKFFRRGFCDASCTRIHKLTAEDEKAFDKFVSDCRASQTDEEKRIFNMGQGIQALITSNPAPNANQSH
jgi:hypothetical protein